MVIFMKRIIFHIDVNNAFLSWSALDLLNHGSKIDIRNTYAVIGGDEKARRGIVLAKSNLCKKLGIQTADTLYSARKKCPSLKIYPANYSFYKQKSDQLFKLIRSYSPDIEILSIDECFLDYTKVRKLYGDPVSFAYQLKDQIKKQLKFTVNIGIGENKLTAKMASDFEKPDKVHTLWEEEVPKKMFPLPVGNLYGVGKKSTEKLVRLQIKTIEDLAHADLNFLYKYFKNNAYSMIEAANGRNNEEVISDSADPKGISNSTTLAYDYTSFEEVRPILLSLSENVAYELHKQKKYAYVVAVQIKDNFFKTSSHQMTLTNAINTTKEIYEASLKLFQEFWDKTPIRLLGIRLDHLSEKPAYQVSLFEKPSEKKENKELENVIFDLKNKYGKEIIKVATPKKVEKKYLK